MATKEQLTQWEDIVCQMRAVGVRVNDLGLVTVESRYVQGIINQYFEAVVSHDGIGLSLESSTLTGAYPLRCITLTRPLQEGQDFTHLPISKRPSSITLGYSSEGIDLETLTIVMGQLMEVGQKRVPTDEIDPYQSRIEFVHNLVTKGELRFYQVFQRPQRRTNCSFEIDITPKTSEWFERGWLPNHTKQEDHFCENTPTIPLFPIPLGAHIKNFVAFFNDLQNLPTSRFNELFRGMTLPPGFSIYYGINPYVLIASGYGGSKLEMEVYAEHVRADKVAEAFYKHIGLFDQYYGGFQPYSKNPVVVS